MHPFSYSGLELDAMTGADNYYRWILGQFAPYLGKRVIEVGAGTGTFSEFLLQSTNLRELVLVEPADNLFPLLQQRFSGDTRIKLVQGFVEEQAATLSADSVVLLNVLEHIEDDRALLETIHHILAPNGAILLFVPALPQLYGTLDKAFDHFRRYTKRSLGSKLENAGFHLGGLRYMNFPGVVTWMLAGKLLRRRTLRRAEVRFYDQWILPWVRNLEKIWEPPIGQSLIAIARR